MKEGRTTEGLALEERMRCFGDRVGSLIRGEDMGRREAREMFAELMAGGQPEMQEGAFLAALTAKGATPEEIAGGWEAVYELDTAKVKPCVSPLVENCGTGMDAIKTFNISTAAAIVAAGGGVYMARHGSRAITSRCGTVDLLELLGLDAESPPYLVKRSIEDAGIGLFNGMSPSVHPGALPRILSQIRFGTVLNITASLANPARPSRALRGVYSRDMVLSVARTMREIGYECAMVVHGLDGSGCRGMDEISTLGVTQVAEIEEDGSIREYSISPGDLGLEDGCERDLLCGPDRELEALRMLRLLAGAERGSRRDIVLANAAALLYLAGRASSLIDGVGIAEEIIDGGSAIHKLRAWIGVQGSIGGDRRLARMLEMALV
ncbi:MAG: anthranilate phosphoribosyltransferase [Methanotrichaceae archaeon]|nr:anthranilate phosphoribosyltransferase [Methanotrichaceae archaeon]